MITKEDFTIKWGLVAVLAMSLFMLAIFGIFWPTRFLYSVYCSLCVLLFGIYLIIDTQLIIGGKRIALTIDEYVAAALLLYVDIITIFLYILQMFGRK
jgi:FtsH-binding integral membrane protein